MGLAQARPNYEFINAQDVGNWINWCLLQVIRTCRKQCLHSSSIIHIIPLCIYYTCILLSITVLVFVQVAEPGTRDQVTVPGGFLQQDGRGLLTAPPPPQPSPSLLGAVPSILPEPPSHLPPPNYGGPIRPLPPPMGPPPIILPPGFTPTSITPPIHPFPSIDVRGQTLQSHSNAIQPQTYVEPTNIFVGNDSNCAKPNVSCNVQLPPSFDVEVLFPDEHPQVCNNNMYYLVPYNRVFRGNYILRICLSVFSRLLISRIGYIQIKEMFDHMWIKRHFCIFNIHECQNMLPL